MLTLYNSLSRKKEIFRPVKAGEVKMFTCGPSIYQRPHIGNYRTFLYEDVLQRYLEYMNCIVIRALNFTDIEDKSILEAKKYNTDVLELTQQFAMVFFDDLKLLNIKPPTYNPKSSTSVEQAVQLIRELLDKGYAYWHKGNVYFDIHKYRDFGKLGRPDMSRLAGKKRRFHRDTYPGNYWNLGDFILWHGYREGDSVYWDTAIGRGRPAWNIQDPAMAVQTLGFNIDIYCGGEDNLVRHHDYSIAIAESASGREMARYWLHGAHLLVDGKKMSKSKGNVIYPDDLLKLGYTGEEIRFFLINENYKKRLNFTTTKFIETAEKLRQARRMIDEIQKNVGKGDQSYEPIEQIIENMKLDFEKNMDNNLDVKQAFDDLLNSLSKLAGLTAGRISQKEQNKIMSLLSDIDTVLQVFGLSNVYSGKTDRK